nr:sugar phosphate nucleotidyltransferase [Bacillus tianshenii]
MAGGQGTRFWPWSVKKKPKQFMSLNSSRTMIQETYERFSTWLPPEKIYVITTKEYLGLVAQQLPQLSPDQIIIEPARKDTAPCVALASLYFIEKGENEVLVFTPSDHYISDTEVLFNTLKSAEKVAEIGNSIVTLGIKPEKPDTGYGYISASKENTIDSNVLKISEFIEKPEIETAKKLLENKNVYWNSGLFIGKPSTIEYFMKKYQKNIWDTLKDSTDLVKAYSTLPKLSIDYAILEKADEIYTIPTELSWDDLGTWRSLEHFYNKDSDQNIKIGNVKTICTNNCLIVSEICPTLVLGVKDIIIVLTDDGLLVCHKSLEQEIKKLINMEGEK